MHFSLIKSESCILHYTVGVYYDISTGVCRNFTTDAALLAFTKKALRIYLAAMFLFGIQISCQMAFNSLGKALSSIVVAVVRKFVLLIPLIYIMPAVLQDKTSAVYMAEPVADTIAVTFTAILFSSNSGRQ